MDEITEEVKAVRHQTDAASKEVGQAEMAHAYADAIKAGMLKSRPVDELLNEI